MKPILPPHKGYVEVVVNGQHMYQNTLTGRIVRTPADERSSDESGNSSVYDELAEAYREGVNTIDE